MMFSPITVAACDPCMMAWSYPTIDQITKSPKKKTHRQKTTKIRTQKITDEITSGVIYLWIFLPSLLLYLFVFCSVPLIEPEIDEAEKYLSAHYSKWIFFSSFSAHKAFYYYYLAAKHQIWSQIYICVLHQNKNDKHSIQCCVENRQKSEQMKRRREKLFSFRRVFEQLNTTKKTRFFLLAGSRVEATWLITTNIPYSVFLRSFRSEAKNNKLHIERWAAHSRPINN